MKKFIASELEKNGLNSLNGLDTFEISYDAYSKDYDIWHQKILNNGFVKNSSRYVGRDLEIIEISYRKKYQSEIDSENLQLQISILEENFNIKISYTKK